MILLGLMPITFVARQYLPGHSLTKLLDVGWIFLPRALPQFQALNPVTPQPKGYDGQWYAQIAIDPTLRDPQFRTMGDNPEYLGRRILMPALAWAVGFGRPAAAVNVYALLNLAAWYALLALILVSQRPVTVRAWCCVVAIMLGTGVFASLSRSMTDLPAATFLMLAAVLARWSRAIALSLSALTRESSLLCMWAPMLDLPVRGRLWRAIAQISIIVLPWTGWAIYLHWRLHMGAYGESNFAWPFQGWVHAMVSAVVKSNPTKLLALISLLLQFAYLVWHPQPRSIYWRFAISFAVAGAFLGSDPLGGQSSFTRDLLPMTIGFNILMMTEPLSLFRFWFIGGNVGLAMGLIHAAIVTVNNRLFF